jgi:hypothetical protein
MHDEDLTPLPAGEDIPLNPKIVKTVNFLREHGFDTIDSGDGETHACECDRDYPYVVMRSHPMELASEADRLAILLFRHGVRVGENSEQDEQEHPLPCITASYDPINGRGLLELMFLSDENFQAVAVHASVEDAVTTN